MESDSTGTLPANAFPPSSAIPPEGTRLTITINDIAFGGDGVGRWNEFVIFVPFALIGEEVEVELVEVKKRFGRAKLIQVLKPSPDRVTPQCRYFGECGGCQYQHVRYPVQLQMKHKQITDLFQRIGGLSAECIAPVIPCPQPYGYRNRIMVRSQWHKFKQALEVGFLRADSRLLVDVEECAIAEPILNEQLKRVRANPPPRGGIKVTLRSPPADWEVPPDSFFQNNYFLLPQLTATVRQFFQEGGARHVLDLYCGVGFFGIELADLAESFVGVEYDQKAIQAARRNCQARGRVNGQFTAAMVEEAVPTLIKKFSPEATSVILDPPRKGCPPGILELLRQERPRQVIYISCHPATMARDLNILCGDGVFKLMRLVPLDMFPQTQHVECVADLRICENQDLPSHIASAHSNSPE